MEKKEFQLQRTRIISKMLDNPDKIGIYPTLECYKSLDELYDKIQKTHEGNYQHPSAYQIGHKVDVTGMNGEKLYIRAIIFTNSKIRYSIYDAELQTTFHNVDSVYISQPQNSSTIDQYIDLGEDNYS